VAQKRPLDRVAAAGTDDELLDHTLDQRPHERKLGFVTEREWVGNEGLRGRGYNLAAKQVNFHMQLGKEHGAIRS
jgi:hypothetical protein